MEPGAVELVEEHVAVDGLALAVLRPPDAEALLSEEAFEREEFLPYWAELWPSGVALARAIAPRSLGGKRVLELGAGLGIPSLVAALRGAAVLATDWSPDAVGLLRRNADRNGVELEAAVASWFRPDELAASGPWDLVLAADVLYERRNVAPLLALLPALAPAALVADPRRPAASEFLERARVAWDVQTTLLSSSPLVELHAIRIR